MKKKNDTLEFCGITLSDWQSKIKKQEFILYEKANDLWGADENSWEDYILFLQILPRLVLGELGINFEPTDDSEATAWFIILKNYYYHAEWMNFLNPGDKRKAKMLDDELGLIMKPYADFSKAMLNLCVELYSRVPDLQQFGCPAEIWLRWEVLQCWRIIKQTGLIQGFYQQNPPKETFLSEAKALSKWMNEISKSSKDEEVFPKGIPSKGNIETFIITTTAEIRMVAWSDKDIGFRKAVTDLNKAHKIYYQHIRNTKGFGGYELQNGKIVETGRSGKRKPQIVGKEFIPSAGYVTKSLHKKG